MPSSLHCDEQWLATDNSDTDDDVPPTSPTIYSKCPTGDLVPIDPATRNHIISIVCSLSQIEGVVAVVYASYSNYGYYYIFHNTINSYATLELALRIEDILQHLDAAALVQNTHPFAPIQSILNFPSYFRSATIILDLRALVEPTPVTHVPRSPHLLLSQRSLSDAVRAVF